MIEIRYRALRIWWIRALLGIIICVPVLTMLGGSVVLLTLESVAGVLGALMCLAVALLCVALVLISTRLQFIVDDEGLTLLHYLRPRRIRWEEVAVVEQNTSYWGYTGAVVVVLREPSGQRVTAFATTDRMAIYRGELAVRFSDPATALRPPARAAIAAHRRWLAAARR